MEPLLEGAGGGGEYDAGEVAVLVGIGHFEGVLKQGMIKIRLEGVMEG